MSEAFTLHYAKFPHLFVHARGLFCCTPKGEHYRRKLDFDYEVTNGEGTSTYHSLGFEQLRAIDLLVLQGVVALACARLSRKSRKDGLFRDGHARKHALALTAILWQWCPDPVVLRFAKSRGIRPAQENLQLGALSARAGRRFAACLNQERRVERPHAETHAHSPRSVATPTRQPAGVARTSTCLRRFPHVKPLFPLVERPHQRPADARGAVNPERMATRCGLPHQNLSTQAPTTMKQTLSAAFCANTPHASVNP